MKNAIGIFAVCSAALISGCNRASVPERGTRLASVARAARLNNQSQARISCPEPQPMTLDGLAQATKYATVAIVEPAGTEVSPNGGDEIRTWIKFHIVEMLRERRTAGMTPANLPARFSPIGDGDFVAWFCGGTVTVNGVQITEDGPPPPPFEPGKRYLVWIGLTQARTASFAWSDEGVFVINDDKLRPITTAGANTPFDRELLTQVGTSLAQVRAYLAAK